ncbi:PDZ domain-containing protein [Salirhabdus sp. Marseille-P4669]|uniref:PDZ domain-containing protein n=1 Tax=Salirhabdus sp. Marseille-P4669 TaxID=2042310 RepID=UPI000C7D12AC|nr:PDZ domain-containing protein [Salirhabdus sp. Marseille-P4669]
MMEAWLIEIGNAFLWLFGQPLFYWVFLLTFLTSYFRRKRERKSFGTALYPIGSEWKKTVLVSIVSSLVLSILLIVLGGVIPYSVLLTISIASIILSITGALTLLSPAYTFGLTILVIWGVNQFNVSFIPSNWASDFEHTNLTLLLGLCTLLLVLETILFFTTKKEYGFARLLKGKRGKYVGRHALRRLAVVPLVIPVPSGMIESFAPWWPLFPIGNDGYSLMILPFLIGIQQVFQGMYVDQGGKLLGKWNIGFIVIIGMLTAGSYFYPILAVVGAAVAIFGRLIITLWVQFSDQEKQGIYTPQPDSLFILSVIPNTPADKMGLKVGEKIEKVHQIPVSNEQEFYDALQENRAFCKLEVRTIEGELRFVQGPMYEGEHYELGLVFIKEKPRFRLYPQDIPSSLD